MEAILTSSNQMYNQLYRFQCTGQEQNVSLKSDKLISKSVKCCVLNLSGEEVFCEEGYLFENSNCYNLDINLKKPGIYMVKVTIEEQNIVEPLYFI
jgi:hypothetical protein